MSLDCLSLHWLPAPVDFNQTLAEIREAKEEPNRLFDRLVAAANQRLDFIQTRKLERVLNEVADRLIKHTPRIRLSLQGSATLDHLVPGIRIAGLRRGLLIDVQVGPFGQWRQQILDEGSELHAFEPDVVALMLDANALVPDMPATTSHQAVDEAIDDVVSELRQLWRRLREERKAVVIQQTPWSDEPQLFGHYERLVPASPTSILDRLDREIALAAQSDRTILLDLRAVAAGLGARQLGDVALWHHAKQTITPAAVPLVGDHFGRILAAIRGLSKKVLVLDLDNTLWGGVIGDDGVEGIVLGQGNAQGEAFVAFQRYAKRLASRGVVLAVSSKNDRAVAEAAITDHPEMILRMGDFAAFEADWNDKPSALKRMAEQLDLGLDSFVFVDDNPVERALMRKELPQVAVPELPEAVELYPRAIADAGYFEAVGFTADDTQRNEQYVANRERRKLQSSVTDLDGFLRELDMTMTVSPFKPADIARITQLINKTNQFNLTTRRYTEAEVSAMINDPSVLTFTARLKDRFGDNGLTSIVIGRQARRGAANTVEVDTWLMSCRVLGRRVEEAMLSVLARDAIGMGVDEIVGRYIPSAKNGMVKDHYKKLGFEPLENSADGGETLWRLQLSEDAVPKIDHVNLVREVNA